MTESRNFETESDQDAKHTLLKFSETKKLEIWTCMQQTAE
jgi:hypothetical protein